MFDVSHHADNFGRLVEECQVHVLADRILVLEDGRIKEDGTHEALLARNGTYAELFHLQAAAYR